MNLKTHIKKFFSSKFFFAGLIATLGLLITDYVDLGELPTPLGYLWLLVFILSIASLLYVIFVPVVMVFRAGLRSRRKRQKELPKWALAPKVSIPAWIRKGLLGGFKTYQPCLIQTDKNELLVVVAGQDKPIKLPSKKLSVYFPGFSPGAAILKINGSRYTLMFYNSSDAAKKLLLGLPPVVLGNRLMGVAAPMGYAWSAYNVTEAEKHIIEGEELATLWRKVLEQKGVRTKGLQLGNLGLLIIVWGALLLAIILVIIFFVLPV